MGGNDNDDNRKIILCEWIVKGKIALGKALVCKSKLRICISNISFMGVTLRTRLQEKANRIIFIVRVSFPN